MRIFSRANEDQVQLDRLREIIEAATDGAITHGSTLPQLVTQLEDVVLNYMEVIESQENAYDDLQLEAATLAAQCAMQDDVIARLTTASFDEALDDATIDLMDAFLGSGAANSTFCGDISFDSAVTFTKQDLKPLLRQAIITWISTKVR